jgi:hypothetical protein
VARADNFIRDLLPEEDSWPRFFQLYQEALDEAITDGAIAFKSVIAYRTGLDIALVSKAEAGRNFDTSRNSPESEQKAFRDFLSKILYGADGSVPEALWIVARRFKAVLGRLLEDLVAESFCSRRGAFQLARCILRDNAVRLYSL